VSWQDWVVLVCVVAIACAAFVSIAWSWRLENENIRLRSRVKMLEDANTNWQNWARAEGFGQTKVIVTARKVQ